MMVELWVWPGGSLITPVLIYILFFKKKDGLSRKMIGRGKFLGRCQACEFIIKMNSRLALKSKI